MNELPALDRLQLLRDVELQALRDSQSDWSRVGSADAPPASAHREIDKWAEQRVAQVAAARSMAERDARARIREADAEVVVAEERRANADAVAAAAEGRREEIGLVLRGEQRGDDHGNWADRGRMHENPRRRKTVDLLIYGCAASAEVGLNYLAFRLMGATAVETALLAGAIVLVTVLLPKQIGTLVTTSRRTRRWSGPPLVLMLSAATLWIGTVAFVALVRTAYLLLPQQVGSSTAQPLLTVAGVESTTLTLGWLAVGLAVGLVVLIRSAYRHNPYVSAWHAINAEVGRLGEERSLARDTVERAAELAAMERDVLRATHDRFAPLYDECLALAAELKGRYLHALSRRQASIEQMGLHGQVPALESPAEGEAA